MRRVILESPYGGDVEANVAYARRCLGDCLRRGESPIASHLLFTQKGVLDDLVPEERALGIAAGLAWRFQADASVFYAGPRLVARHARRVGPVPARGPPARGSRGFATRQPADCLITRRPHMGTRVIECNRARWRGGIQGGRAIPLMTKRQPHEPRKWGRPAPDIRIKPDHVMIDGVDSYARAVVGAQPENFRDLIGFVQDLLPVANEVCGVDPKDQSRSFDEQRADTQRVRDTLLLAAWSLTEMANEGQGENPTAFVQRAKQVIGWCKPQTQGLSVLEHMENKAREIARLIGQRLYRHEGFVLIVFDQSSPEDTKARKGSMTWLTSIARNTTIELVGEWLANLKADQGERS